MEPYVIYVPNGAKVMWTCENTGEKFALLFPGVLTAKDACNLLRYCYRIEKVESK